MLCTSRFFGTRELPQVDLTEEELQILANESVKAGLTVPGVQKKLSMHLLDSGSPRLTIVGSPAGYILKPQTSEYPCLPEAEDMVMDIAQLMGVRTVPHGLIDTASGYAYITKRVDRREGKDRSFSSLAMEDFCQLMERPTAEKYKSSYERCAFVIDKYSSMPGIDKAEFFLRLVVSFITGNSDMHLKNFSLVETSPGSREYVLSAAYDMLPVNLVLPEDKEETALTLCGKRANFRRKDFIAFAESISVPKKAAENLIDSCLDKTDQALAICDGSYMTGQMKECFAQLLVERVARLR